MNTDSLLLFRERTVRHLRETILENIEKYRSGDFKFLMSDTTNFFEVPHKIDLAAAERITCTPVDQNEVACTLSAFNAFPTLTPYLARDERLWVYLTHIIFLDYSRARWPIPDEDNRAVAHIKKHFFATGARGIERDNAISRLWWMALICSRVRTMPLERALKVFLHQTDVRANIVERPTTAQNINVLSSVLQKLGDSYEGDKGLYERERFRGMMKELNLKGGTKLLEVLDTHEVIKIVDKCARL